MDFKKIFFNLFGFVAAQQAMVAALPPEWQGYGAAAVVVATSLAGLFQESPKK